MTFDAVPPGQQPTRMTPRARSGGKAKTFVSSHAMRGITVNCARQPVSTSLGRLKTMRKSEGESVRPMPNMISPSIGLMTQVPMAANGAGTMTATTANSSTSAPIQREMKSQIAFMLFLDD